MPGNAPPVATEREAISTYLRQQHDGIRFAAYGLTDEQAHQVSSRSAISIANLVKHVTHTERTWMERARAAGAARAADARPVDQQTARSHGETGRSPGVGEGIRRRLERRRRDDPGPDGRLRRGRPRHRGGCARRVARPRPAGAGATGRPGSRRRDAGRAVGLLHLIEEWPATPVTPTSSARRRRSHDVRADGRRRGLARHDLVQALAAAGGLTSDSGSRG